MANSIWLESRASIVLLPSGEQGDGLLSLVDNWAAAGLIGPALWIRPEDVEVVVGEPPKITATVIGMLPSRELAHLRVDLFEQLARENLDVIRLLKVRSVTPQHDLDKLQDEIVQMIDDYLHYAMPAPDRRMSDIEAASILHSMTLACGTTERTTEHGLTGKQRARGITIIASPEDRTSPWASDAFVRESERFDGFMLMHIASIVGLWNGLPYGLMELMDKEKPVNSGFWVSRTFFSGVLTDWLARRVAAEVIVDTANPSAPLEAPPVGTAYIEDEQVDSFVQWMVETILNIENQVLQYRQLEAGDDPTKRDLGIWDSILGFFVFAGYKFVQIPIWAWRWFVRKVSRKVQATLHGDNGLVEVNAGVQRDELDGRDQILLDDHAAIMELAQQNLVEIQSPVTLSQARSTPELWRRMRELIFAGLDGGGAERDALFPLVDDRRMIFRTVDTLLSDPDAEWTFSEHHDLPEGLPRSFSWQNIESAFEVASSLQAWTEQARVKSDAHNHELFDAREVITLKQARIDAIDVILRENNAMTVDKDGLEKPITISEAEGKSPSLAYAARKGSVFAGPSGETDGSEGDKDKIGDRVSDDVAPVDVRASAKSDTGESPHRRRTARNDSVELAPERAKREAKSKDTITTAAPPSSGLSSSSEPPIAPEDYIEAALNESSLVSQSRTRKKTKPNEAQQPPEVIEDGAEQVAATQDTVTPAATPTITSKTSARNRSKKSLAETKPTLEGQDPSASKSIPGEESKSDPDVVPEVVSDLESDVSLAPVYDIPSLLRERRALVTDMKAQDDVIGKAEATAIEAAGVVQQRQDLEDEFNEWHHEIERTLVWKLRWEMGKQKQRVEDDLIALKEQVENVSIESPFKLTDARKHFHKSLLVAVPLTLAIALLLSLLSQNEAIFTWLEFRGFNASSLPALILVVGLAIVVVIYLGLAAAYHRKWSSYEMAIRIELARLGSVKDRYVNAMRERNRLVHIHRQANEWLELIARVVRKPWAPKPTWLESTLQTLNTGRLPFAMHVAQANDGDQASRAILRTRAFRSVGQIGWRQEAFESMVNEVGRLAGRTKEAFSISKLDEDLPHASNGARQLLRQHVDDQSVLENVALGVLRPIIVDLQTNAMSSARPSVLQVDDNPLSEFRADIEGLDADITEEQWTAFLSHTVTRGGGKPNPVTPLSVLVVSEKNRALGQQEDVQSFCLMPEHVFSRLESTDLNSIRAVTYDGKNVRPLDAVIRFDVTGPIEEKNLRIWENVADTVGRAAIESNKEIEDTWG